MHSSTLSLIMVEHVEITEKKEGTCLKNNIKKKKKQGKNIRIDSTTSILNL